MLTLSSARKVLASCLLLPPILWGVSSLVGPDTGNGNSTADQLKDLQKIAHHKGAFVAANIMFLVGGILFIVATYGIVHVYRGRRVGLGQVAGVLLAFGSANFFAWYAFGLVQYEMVNHADLRSPSTQLLFARLLHFGSSSGPGAVIFVTFILGIVLGAILLGIAMLRRRNVPVWAGVLTIASGPLSFFLNGQVGSAISFVVLLAALAPLALLIWSMSDEEWDAPRDVAGARRSASATPEPGAPTPAAAV